jgi:hypothetical protein
MSDLQHQRIVELCQELRLSAMPNLYSGIAQSAAAKEASFADFLEETLRAERDARSVRAREMFARVAGFPTLKTLDSFDFGFATGVPRPQIHELAGLAFIERAEVRYVFSGALNLQHQLDQLILVQALRIIPIHPNLESATRTECKGWVIARGHGLAAAATCARSVRRHEYTRSRIQTV